MKFQYDSKYAYQVGEHFGKYQTTFVSDKAEVLAHLFEEEDGTLIAYICFQAGVNGETVHDNYLGPLNKYAEEHRARLHLRYA